MKKNNSPYSASITGGGYLQYETDVMLPLLMSDNAEALIRDELLNNRLLHINAETSRSRAVTEVKRRYQAMPRSFWDDYLLMSDNDRQVALLLVILKTYKILFDFHIEVTIKRWNSIDHQVTSEDYMMEFNEISSRDAFVDSWTALTKKKVIGAYITILRKVGMIDNQGLLQPLRCDNFHYYLIHGEAWFLEACLLQKYEIDNIKKQLR